MVWQYRAALLVGGLVVTAVLVPTVHYLKTGKVGRKFFVTKGCFTPGCGPDDGVICKTKACKNTANRILSYMDPSVDKCQNFYKFACGKFLQTAKIEEDQTFISAVTEVNLKLSKQMKKILESKPKRGDPPSFITVRQLYSLCMDEKNIKAQGLQPLKQFLDKAGGWPMLDPGWNSAEWDLSKTALRLRHLGANADSLFKLMVFKNNDRLTLQVDQPELLLPREVFLNGINNPMVRLHYSYSVEMAVLMGVDRDVAEADMADIYKLEIFLAQFMTPAEQRIGQGNSGHYPLEYLKTELGFLDWSSLVQGTIPSGADDNILVFEIDYINDLGDVVLKSFTPRTLMNYMIWYAISDLTHLLTDQARELEFNYKKELYGFKAREPRWRECVKVANKMTHALSALYVREHLGDDTKTGATDIAKRVREELRLDMQRVQWMDEPTKVLADSKAQKMVLNIGYTEKLGLKGEPKEEETYEGLQIDKNNYFQAYIDLERWRNNRAKDYQAILTESSGLDDMSTVNAMYIRSRNSLHFPASYLQPPYYSVGAPGYVNYATLGYAMGHEMTHGFDELGSKYDADGLFREWWDEPTQETFTKKTECMINQYSGFVDSEAQLALNGRVTLNENMADNGGVKMAYHAYKRLETSLAKMEQGLPGLEQYNNDQLFFLSFANHHCAAYRPDVLKGVIVNSDHPPEEFRVNGALMNLPEFGDVFGCRPGAPMNPQDKCGVW